MGSVISSYKTGPEVRIIKQYRVVEADPRTLFRGEFLNLKLRDAATKLCLNVFLFVWGGRISKN